MSEIFGVQRRVSVSREISKIHDESLVGSCLDVIAHYTQQDQRVECVIVVAGVADEKKDKTKIKEKEELDNN